MWWGQRSCGQRALGNADVFPSSPAPQQIPRSAIRSLFKFAEPGNFCGYVAIIHPAPCSGTFLLGVLTDIFCSSEEAIKKDTTAMQINFSTNIWLTKAFSHPQRRGQKKWKDFKFYQEILRSQPRNGILINDVPPLGLCHVRNSPLSLQRVWKATLQRRWAERTRNTHPQPPWCIFNHKAGGKGSWQINKGLLHLCLHKTAKVQKSKPPATEAGMSTAPGTRAERLTQPVSERYFHKMLMCHVFQKQAINSLICSP